MIGHTVSHFRILEHLGGGCMCKNGPRIPRSGMSGCHFEPARLNEHTEAGGDPAFFLSEELQ
jgi:hypothetical protein